MWVDVRGCMCVCEWRDISTVALEFPQKNSEKILTSDQTRTGMVGTRWTLPGAQRNVTRQTIKGQRKSENKRSEK
jgi:hypothetical protein